MLNKKGFTLIELVVVLGLFMLIMGVTVTLFISIVRQQKRILSQQEMINQVTYLEDEISRNLRQTEMDPSGICLGTNAQSVYMTTHGNQGIRFFSKENGCQEYFLDADGVIKEIKNGSSPQPLLSAKYAVRYLRFVVLQNTRVTMVLNVQDMIIQITVSQR